MKAASLKAAEDSPALLLNEIFFCYVVSTWLVLDLN